MRFLLALLPLLTALLVPMAAHAADKKPADEQVEIDGKKPVIIKPDRAYLLFRVKGKWFAPVFMRIPTDAEVAAFQAAKQLAFNEALPKLRKELDAARAKQRAASAKGQPMGSKLPDEPSLDQFDYHYPDVQNLWSVNLGKALEKNGDERLMLIEAVPGDYVLYGAGNKSAMLTCMCLGTVGFSAQAGAITDLGTVHTAIAWQKSDDPVLAAETGLGASVNGHWALPAMGISLPEAGASAPAALADRAIVPVTYRAVGKFIGPPVFGINRLVPVPGVLAYDRGVVVDAKSGQPVADNY